MATKKKTTDKKNRKPSSTKVIKEIIKDGKKVVKEFDSIKDALKAEGKPSTYKGKMTSNAKSELVNKTLNDPADKKAIEAAKSLKTRNEIAKKAEEKELKRGIKASRKEAGRKKAEIRAKNAEIDKKNAVREQLRKQSTLKTELKAKQDYRKSKAAQDAAKAKEANKAKLAQQKAAKTQVSKARPEAVNAKKLPNEVKLKVEPQATGLKPRTSKNAAKLKVTDKKPQAAKSKSTSKAVKTAVGAGAVVAGAKLASDKAKTARENTRQPSNPESPQKESAASKSSASKQSSPAKTTQKKSTEIKVANPRKVDKDAKKVSKDRGQAPSTSSAVDAAIKKANESGNAKKLSSKDRATLAEMARKKLQEGKKSNIPWDKILESVTMLLSSYILRGGISKRYK